MVAMTVLVVVVAFVYQVLQNSVRGQNMVREGLRASKVHNAILGQIFKDFRYIWWDGFTGDTGFFGSSHSLGGMEADAIDFVTARPSRTAQMDPDAPKDAPPSPITEVGYALRVSEKNPDYLELWRREDWFVDDNPVRGGKYSLIYDRITTFNLQYFPIPEENLDGRGTDEWDTRAKKKLPYAIVLDVRFHVDEGGDPERNRKDREEGEERIRRIIVLKNAYNVARPAAPGQGGPRPNPGG
jgi:hypothetical protein